MPCTFETILRFRIRKGNNFPINKHICFHIIPVDGIFIAQRNHKINSINIYSGCLCFSERMEKSSLKVSDRIWRDDGKKTVVGGDRLESNLKMLQMKRGFSMQNYFRRNLYENIIASLLTLFKLAPLGSTVLLYEKMNRKLGKSFSTATKL